MLKDEYGKLLYFAYRNRSVQEKLIYILAAKDFNQAYTRLKYTQLTADYLKQQAQTIVASISELEQSIQKLEQINKEQLALKQEKRAKLAELKEEKIEQQQLVNNFSANKARIQREYNKNKAKYNSLAKFVSQTVKVDNNGNTAAITAGFKKNRGKHIWATKEHYILSKFGSHKHPVLKGVYIQNDGIGIGTKSNAEVFVIYQGVVSRVMNIPGGNKAVIVKHGNYYTVYSNLRTVYVKQNDKLKRNTKIGIVADSDNKQIGLLNFQIWKGTEKLNPVLWLK